MRKVIMIMVGILLIGMLIDTLVFGLIVIGVVGSVYLLVKKFHNVQS